MMDDTIMVGEMIDLAYGKSLSADNRRPGDIPVYGSNGIVGLHDIPAVDGPGIIVGRKGSVGAVTYSEGPFWPIDTTYYVVNKGGHDWRFLFHFLRTLGLERLNSHSAVPGLNREDVYGIAVTHPGKANERVIGRLLDQVERAIAIEDTALRTVESLKRATMRELFTRGLHGEAQKETEIGPIPDSWSLVKAENIFKLSSGKTRPALSAQFNPESPYPVLGGNGVMGFSSSWNFEADKGLIIGRVGEYCGAVHVSSGRVWITDNALYARDWLNPHADVGFVAAFLRYFDLNRFKRMAGQPLVTQGMINEHSIPIPRPEEQRAITSILDAIDTKAALHQRKHTLLQELLDALLQKLMTAEILVTDLDLSALEMEPDA